MWNKTTYPFLVQALCIIPLKSIRMWASFCIFVTILDSHINMERKLLNRIKVVLAEKNRSNKWLSEQLDKDPAIISKWVTNTTQPNVETLIQISKVLGVTVDDLLRTE